MYIYAKFETQTHIKMKKALICILLLSTISIFGQNTSENKASEGRLCLNPKHTISHHNIINNDKSILENNPITNLFVNELGYATWDAPEINIDFPIWIQYIDDIATYWGANNGDMDAAIKWNPIQLVGFEDAAITKIKFYTGYSTGSNFTI